ncbi:hypothetical protein [Methanobrevibacter woesei]|mgnify:CR=1 FL=1|uniref:hypothetical protein n=1 Tax=Methanobrevibacter woesei TaxID=190976 RepID=UPI0023540878|nr:hypothetical protein [Methanobrevibacter woesei]
MKNERGYVAVFEALMVIFLVLTCVLFLNSVVVTSNPSLSQKADNFNKAQDIMEALSGKVNFTDETFLSEISNILSDRWDKNKAIQEVSKLAKPKFEELGLKDNYKFVEVNEFNGATLLSSGNYDSAENISIASRNYGDYCYRLYVW